jgi:hypothetical protein
MSGLGRIWSLQEQFPDTPSGILEALPAGFENDAQKFGAFVRTWEKAMDLAQMLERRITDLSRIYQKPFPALFGPTFQELAAAHAGGFLGAVKEAAQSDGRVEDEVLMGAFGSELRKVRKLERDIKLANLNWEAEQRRLLHAGQFGKVSR